MIKPFYYINIFTFDIKVKNIDRMDHKRRCNRILLRLLQKSISHLTILHNNDTYETQKSSVVG